MIHHCHAHKCDARVPAAKFVCPMHWRILPALFKAAILREYRAGQEVTKTPSLRYMAVQRAAVAALAFEPNDETAARACAPYYLESTLWRQRSIDAGAGDPLLGLPGYKAHERIDEAKIAHVIGCVRAEARALGEL